MATSKSVEVIEIRPIEIKRATVRIVGDTPLIMHAWSEKAKREMLEKQMKVTKTKAKAAKDPIEDFIRSMYWKTPMPVDMTQAGFERAISEGARFCFPVTAIKQAAISAAFRMGWAKDKMSMRGAFFIDGDENQMIEIHGDPPGTARRYGQGWHGNSRYSLQRRVQKLVCRSGRELQRKRRVFT